MVSKQEWKDYQSSQWQGGQVKTTLDELMQAFAALHTAIDGDDVSTFLAYTQDDGKLMEATTNAAQASSGALQGIQALRLEGNQRRFANKEAITASDAASDAVSQYHMAVGLLLSGLVRGVRLEHDEVENDQNAMSGIKSGDLKDRLEGERYRVQECYDYATQKVAALAAVDKIGVI